jgi:hypothetical protein
MFEVYVDGVFILGGSIEKIKILHRHDVTKLLRCMTRV